MNEHQLQELINNKEKLQKQIREFLEHKLAIKQKPDIEEIQGHVEKAEHNLRFVKSNIELEFFDWALVGCYYATYHSALALIQHKGYSSKNHLATLCILIKKYYDKELTKKDLSLLMHFLDYHDVLFYVQAKNKREQASYSSKITFSKQEAEQTRLQAILFINKAKEIIKNN